MKQVMFYIHGKGGNAHEFDQFKAHCPEWDFYGINLVGDTPWETNEQIQRAFNEVKNNYETVHLLANSIGAYLAMDALKSSEVEKAYFISPILDMEQLIREMMHWVNVSEVQLREAGEIATDFGETLSWKYLNYTRNNPIEWQCETQILYGEKDTMTSYETVARFVDTHPADVTVMNDGEHWFHTPEQLIFLYQWLANFH